MHLSYEKVPLSLNVLSIDKTLNQSFALKKNEPLIKQYILVYKSVKFLGK